MEIYFKNKDIYCKLQIYDKSPNTFIEIVIDNIISRVLPSKLVFSNEPPLKKKNYIKISNNTETKYIILSNSKKTQNSLKFNFLNIEIEIVSDNKKFEEIIFNPKLLAFQKILNNIKNTTDFIQKFPGKKNFELIFSRGIYDFSAKLSIELNEFESNSINEILNFLSNLKDIKYLENIKIYQQNNESLSIEFRYFTERPKILNEDLFKLIKIIDGKTFYSIIISQNTFKLNYDLIENIDEIKNNLNELIEFAKIRSSNSIYEFFKNFNNLEFITESGEIEKFLAKFKNIKEKLIEIKKILDLFYL